MLEFDHIALSVPNVMETVEFYKHEFPNVRVAYHDATWALIEIGTLKLAFVTQGQHPPHMAFRTHSREELERLASESEAPIMLHRDGSESFYQEDPGGNTIEIIFYP